LTTSVEKNHVSTLELDMNALKHNVNYFKDKLKPATKILAVVKAFAYGHDAVAIAKILEKLNIDYLAVAYVDEGISLRKNGIETPILVLHPQIQNFRKIIEYKLEPNIYSEKTLIEFSAIVKELSLKNYPIHLKFNTGLNRLGFSKNQIDFILEAIKNSPLKIQSIFSHLAASEDLQEKEFTKNQISKFNTIVESIQKSINYKPILHLSNTSGIINYPEAHFDMVRLGIGMYGFGNDKAETKNLKNVGTLKSTISQIHTIKKGESLGYNRAFFANSEIKTATIPIGHADGINRRLGNGVGYVTINNQKCSILGNVCMDMIMVNITDVDCQEGDDVIIFDNQETINDFAQKSDTISYEIITGISQRIHRKVIS
jgi:alanine racemase